MARDDKKAGAGAAKKKKTARKKSKSAKKAAPSRAERTQNTRGKPPPVGPAAESASESRPARRKRTDFPLVVLGASAGGLDAFKRFLAAMPATSGMAFILVPHLDPRRESMMVELLSRQTRMPVVEAEDGMAVAGDHVYVIPPNRFLAVRRRKIELSEPPAPHGFPTAIDFTLTSLAHGEGDAAIGVVMSGTGSHGVLGVKEIKLQGGVVLVQDPATAEYDQMPRSAIATGVVDQVLSPEGIAEALVSYAQRTRPPESEPYGAESTRNGLRRVLSLLQARAGQDFRHYRKKMIVRRIQRRIALLGLDSWDAYVEYLRDNADEAGALGKDLLITVTGFFRDADAFAELARQALPELVERADSETPVRVWVPGCATGEEPYSIAILLFEQFRAAAKAPHIQIFATDIDDGSLEVARRGVYADSIAAAVSPERLKRFFTKVGEHHYEATKPLRESIVFARQNLISDAPFSKLDLISCRNVLIYLDSDVQEKIISLLHFALREDGFLFLGPSESIGRAHDMFAPVSKKWRLYRRIGPSRRDRVSIPIVTGEHAVQHAAFPEPARRPRAPFSALMQRLLAEDFAPASALIGRDYEILAVQGPLVNYLSFPAGEMTRDVLALARPGLRSRIRAACQTAASERRTVTDSDARVRRNGGYVPCTVTVKPVTQADQPEGLALVVFEDRQGAEAEQGRAARESTGDDSVVEHLENELRTTREELSSTIEELETSNEELKASNEEVMSMNEELQSTNEELETSKEELQSLNEELATVNSQLQDKVEELDQSNNDLVNLIAATDIPTVFLDTELRIQRFTEPTTRLLNLMSTDIGRSFADFAPRFEDHELLDDARGVLATLGSSEKEVHTEDGRWYLRRILPYKDGEGRVGGVVITFFDITERMAADAQARRLATVLMDSNDAVTVADLNANITAWNEGAVETYGYPEAKALKMNVFDLAPDDLKGAAREMFDRVAGGEAVTSCEAKRVTRDGRLLDVWVTMTPLRDEQGRIVSVASTERDVTARRQTEEAVRELNESLEQRVAAQTAELRSSEERIRAVLDAAVDAIVTIDSQGVILTFNAAAEKTFGYSADQVVGRNVKMLMPYPHRERHDEYLRRYRETGEKRVIGRVREFTALRRDGTEFPVQLSVNEVAGLDSYTGVVRDLTEQKVLQEEIVRIATLEQRRIGEELHDATQQELTGLGLLAKDLSERLASEGAAREGELAEKLARGIADVNVHVRSLSRGLVPVDVDAEGLMAALEDLARTVEQRYRSWTCTFECPQTVEVADDDVATHLYRIAQEGVVNAVKHSGGNRIRIRLERDDHELLLEVCDNGTGIGESSRETAGAGMRIMEHRCSLVGGKLAVTSGEDGGTVVICRIPMSRQG